MDITQLQRFVFRSIKLATTITALSLLIPSAAAQSFTVGTPVHVSPVGEIVAEFFSVTAPNDPQLMVASAIKRLGPAKTICAVYVSRDGGQTWSEVPAWPDSGFQPIADPWVAIGADGTLHATGVAITKMGARAVYTQSRDQGFTWSFATAVTPFVSNIHRRGADKDCLAVAADGTIYVAFNQLLTNGGESGLIVARSTDQGLSWISRYAGVNGYPNGIATVSGGAVTVAFIAESLGIQYGTVTSTDGGDTWAAPVWLGELNLTNALTLPSIVRDSLGRTVIGNIGGSTTPQIEISIESTDGNLVQQWQLPLPDSDTCLNGHLIQPALTAAPTGSPAFQIACKIEPTKSTTGRLEVWLYPSVDQPTQAPIQVTGFDLPAGTEHDRLAKRFPDGGDYWSLTWATAGWLSMWVDPRSAGGPGELTAALVTADN